MLTFLRDGGVPVLFVLAFGFTGLFMGLAHVRHPHPRHVQFLGWLMQATLYSSLCGLVADLAAVMSYLKRLPAGEDFARTAVTGIGEALVPAILGFALLSLIAFLQAVATRRAAVS